MLVIQEVTDWNFPYDINHIYLSNDSMTKIYGVVRNSNLEFKMFKNGIQFHTKGRKFIKLDTIYSNTSTQGKD